jgi:stress-induced morphogen
MLDVSAVEAMLKASFPDGTITVRDLTGTSDHFEATVVSARFEGVSRVERHRMVYASLGNAMSGPIHALALKTLTPAEA